MFFTKEGIQLFAQQIFWFLDAQLIRSTRIGSVNCQVLINGEEGVQHCVEDSIGKFFVFLNVIFIEFLTANVPYETSKNLLAPNSLDFIYTQLWPKRRKRATYQSPRVLRKLRVSVKLIATHFNRERATVFSVRC